MLYNFCKTYYTIFIKYLVSFIFQFLFYLILFFMQTLM